MRIALCGERDETRLALVSCRGKKGTHRDGAGRAAAPAVRRSAAPRTTRRRRQTCAARMHVDQVAMAGRVGVSMYWKRAALSFRPTPFGFYIVKVMKQHTTVQSDDAAFCRACRMESLWNGSKRQCTSAECQRRPRRAWADRASTFSSGQACGGMARSGKVGCIIKLVPPRDLAAA
jgi:hypothetical protein